MKKYLLLCIILVCFILSSGLTAQQTAEDLGTCFTNSLTGQERKDLALWVFIAMSVHPDIQKYSRITPADRDRSDKFMAQLVTKLMTEKCAKQVKDAYKKDGSAAIETAFGLVGQVAMQEIMLNKDVSASFASFEKYLDKTKINQTLQ